MVDDPTPDYTGAACPACGEPIEGQTEAPLQGGARVMQVGDLCVCPFCAGLVSVAGLQPVRFAVISDAEYTALPEDARAALRMTRAAVLTAGMLEPPSFLDRVASDDERGRW